jgi:neutral ceramidase
MTFRFEALDGDVIAVLFHYACHPTVLGPNTLEYSADWPGAARRRIQAHYPDATVAFLNGAIGNISTRYFRHESTFAEAERLGGLVGERVIELLVRADENPPQLDAASHDVKLPVREFPIDRELDSTGDARRDTTQGEGAVLERELAAAFKGRDSISAQVYALKLGKWTLFGIPGEAFSELALVVREREPNALIVGLVNDYVGYFPTQAAIDAATYEALSSLYDARAHETIFQTLMALIGHI